MGDKVDGKEIRIYRDLKSSKRRALLIKTGCNLQYFTAITLFLPFTDPREPEFMNSTFNTLQREVSNME